MPSGVEVIGCEELEHEEEQVDRETDEHGLVLEVLLIVEPGLRSPPPHVAPDTGPGDGDTFPDPERKEDGPPGPVYHSVQLQCVEDRKQEQRTEQHELARVELLQICIHYSVFPLRSVTWKNPCKLAMVSVTRPITGLPPLQSHRVCSHFWTRSISFV